MTDKIKMEKVVNVDLKKSFGSSIQAKPPTGTPSQPTGQGTSQGNTTKKGGK